MVRVDQARQDDVTLKIEHFIGCGRQLAHRSHLLDEPAANKKTTIGNLPLVVIHSNDVGVFDEKGGHVVV